MTINNYYMDQPTNKLFLTMKTLLMFLEYFSTFLKTKGHLQSWRKKKKKILWLPGPLQKEYFQCHISSYEFIIFYYLYKHMPFSFFLNGLVTCIGLLVRFLLERWRGYFCMLPSYIWKVISDSGWGSGIWYTLLM